MIRHRRRFQWHNDCFVLHHDSWMMMLDHSALPLFGVRCAVSQSDVVVSLVVFCRSDDAELDKYSITAEQLSEGARTKCEDQRDQRRL